MYDTPKVINLFGLENYHDRFPQLSVMAEQSCFVKMLRYDVSIPVRDKADDEFNIFERAVIKLIPLGISNPEMAAETLCIPVELAKFTFSRLIELGVIERNANLTNKGRAYLEARSSDDSFEMMPAVLLALEATGEFLPVVLPAENVSYEMAQFNGGKITMSIGTAGKKETFEGELIKAEKDPDRKHPRPKQAELRKLIDSYNNICAGMNQPPVRFCRDRMIDCSTPTSVYVHVRAAIQNGNVDNIVCSGGMLVNDDMIGRLLNNSPGFKSRLINSAAVTSQDVSAAHKTIRRYEKVLGNMPKPLNLQSSLDELKENSDRITANMQKLFAMLEHAFNYYLKANPPSAGIVAMFRSQDRIDNEAVLMNYLVSMGADIQCNSYAVSQMDRGALEQYLRSGTPTLRTVVPLAVAQAHEDPDSTIRKMISRYPRFLGVLAALARNAGMNRHGGEQMENINESLYERTFQMVIDMIGIILPDIELDGSKSERNSDTLLSGRKARAIAACTSDLGAIRYYSLDPFVQTQLLKTSSDKSDMELPIPSDIVLSFCRVIENMLASYLKLLPGQLIADKEAALNKIAEQTGKDVPVGLRTVNEKNVRNAAAGQHSTLGGLTLVYILNGEPDMVSEFLNRDYHDYISTLTGYRQHGNNIGLALGSAKIKQLRKTLYDLIEFLGG